MFGKQKNKDSRVSTFYAGTSSGTESDGIYKISLDKTGHFTNVKKAANADHPSYLAYSHDRQFLLNVNETRKNNGMGGVESRNIKRDTLKLISQSVSGGGHPCFITTNESGFVLVANYTGGNIGLLRLVDSGKLSDLLDVQQHEGDSVSPRQDAPHAHSAWFEPDGSGIIAADLGTNELWFYRLDEKAQKLVSRPPGRLEMPPGSGPRHLAFHPNNKWIYVINELNSTVTLVQKVKHDGYEIVESVSTLPSNYTDENLPAHVIVSDDGKFLYASNRGQNTIAMFMIDDVTGKLSLIGHVPVHGNWPRHFALSPDETLLVVANRRSDNLVSFVRNPDNGLLEYVDQVQIKEPVCVLF